MHNEFATLCPREDGLIAWPIFRPSLYSHRRHVLSLRMTFRTTPVLRNLMITQVCRYASPCDEGPSALKRAAGERLRLGT